MTTQTSKNQVDWLSIGVAKPSGWGLMILHHKCFPSPHDIFVHAIDLMASINNCLKLPRLEDLGHMTLYLNTLSVDYHSHFFTVKFEAHNQKVRNFLLGDNFREWSLQHVANQINQGWSQEIVPVGSTKKNPWGASISDGYFYMRISETFGQGIPSSAPEINDLQ